ncbi:MAG: glycosyltransferase family 4 protein [bacterium]
MLNVAYIIPHAEIGESPMGGAQVHLILLLKYIDREKFSCRVITGGGGEFVKRVEELGCPVTVVPEFLRPINPLKDYSTVSKLAGILKREPADIVHTHTPKGGLARIAARRAGARFVVHTVHGFGFHDFSSPLKKNIFIAGERFLGRFTDALICVSEESYRRAVENRFVPREKAVCIPNGVDLSSFDPEKTEGTLRGQFGIPSGAPVVGMVGRLDESKDPETFVRAAALVLREHPGAKFVLIGDGPFRGALEETARSLGIRDSVIFAGWRDDVPSLLKDMSVFALTSLREGMPLTLIEAMAMGKPAVATDVIGNREVVVDGETGLLARPRSPESVAAAVVRLLKDPEMMKRAGEAGRRRAVEDHDVRTMVRRTEAVYRRMGEGGKRTGD